MRRATKLGTVVLTNSDMDRSVFGTYLVDGQMDIMDRMTVYTSSKDSVLNGTKTFYFPLPAGSDVGTSVYYK